MAGAGWRWLWVPAGGLSMQLNCQQGDRMKDMPNPGTVWPTTAGKVQSAESGRDLSQGAHVLGFVVALALLLTYICSPWMN
jgi:hypothetical protein